MNPTKDIGYTPNRAGKRRAKALERGADARNRKWDAVRKQDELKEGRVMKNRKRVLRATTRKAEREEAKKKGVKVNYSIK